MDQEETHQQEQLPEEDVQREEARAEEPALIDQTQKETTDDYGTSTPNDVNDMLEKSKNINDTLHISHNNPEELTQNSLFQTNTNAGSIVGNQQSIEQCQDSRINNDDLDDFVYDMEIAKKVEQDKLDQIREASLHLSRSLAEVQGRCPMCTLRPPCKHNNGTANFLSRMTNSQRDGD